MPASFHRPCAARRILDAGVLVAGEDGARLGRREVFRIVGLEHVDPPVLARRRRGGADVERRQRPSSVRTSAGFSSDCAPKRSCSIVAIVVSVSPSSERAITFEPLPRSPVLTRYAITNDPSSSSAALDEPAQKPTPLPGAVAATA